jgi:hypothetical protein
MSVCLCVSLVRCLTTNQQHGIPCSIKRGTLPDWPVWTCARMEGGNATDGEGRTDETDQGGPLRESSPTPPDKTARSDMDGNLPFGLGKGYVHLTEVARPDRQSPAVATKVARPKPQSPSEAVKSQDTFALSQPGHQN